MGTINSTYHDQQGEIRGYFLPPEVAASLRVPKIEYLDNKIPVAVVKEFFPDVLSCARLQDANGTLLLADVMDLMEASMLSNGSACTSCRASCEYASNKLIAA